MELIRIKCRDRGGPVLVTAESGEKVVKLANVNPVGPSEMTVTIEEILMHLADAPATVTRTAEGDTADDDAEDTDAEEGEE